jgi:hypothetical protein
MQNCNTSRTTFQNLRSSIQLMRVFEPRNANTTMERNEHNLKGVVVYDFEAK